MKQIIIILLCFFAHHAITQTALQSGFLPSVNVNKKLKNDWKANVKIESRVGFNLTDMAFVVSKKVGVNQTLAGGYLIRASAGEFIQRYIQQFVITSKYLGFRLGHRISADQTFEEGENPEYRFRYRLTYILPLNGESIDVGESYFKMNNEYLNSFEGDEYDLEIRLVPLLGYKINPKNKFEFGLDYRLSSFLNAQTDNRFWITAQLYVSF